MMLLWDLFISDLCRVHLKKNSKLMLLFYTTVMRLFHVRYNSTKIHTVFHTNPCTTSTGYTIRS